MFDEMGKQIDAVVVGTPDHTHAPAAAMAMRLHKHCYCEKPLTHTVYEARVLAGIAREKNLATQMGTQIHAGVELPPRGGTGPGRGDRPHPRRACVAGGQLRRAAQAGRRPTERCSQAGAARAQHARLGPLARTCAVSTVQWDLCAIPVALLVGIRQRRPGRFLLPLLRLGLLGLEAPASHNGRGRRAGPPRKRRTLDHRPPGVSQPAAICRRSR